MEATTNPADEVRAFSLAKTYMAAVVADGCTNNERAESMAYAVSRLKSS